MVDSEKAKTVSKALFYVGVFAVASLSLLYTFQEKMLYLPGMPIRYSHENPKFFHMSVGETNVVKISLNRGHFCKLSRNPNGYHSPSDRKINYSNVELQVFGGIVLRGWYMKH